MTLQIPAATAESQLLAADAIRQTNAAAEAVASSTLPTASLSNSSLDFSSPSPIDLASPAGSVLVSNLPGDLDPNETSLAILRTDNGDLLLAKGNTADGFHLLSQEDAALLSILPTT